MISVDKYLSKRFDPELYNCWDFTREAWLELTGKDINSIIQPVKRKWLNKGKLSLYETDVITQVDVLDGPKNPCLVYMERKNSTPHMGIFLKNKMLSLDESGASFKSLDLATMFYHKVSYFRW